MTTNERLDEIQSRLNNIENRLKNPQLNNPDAITQLKQQLDRIEGELRRAAIRDAGIAWLTFMAVGAGFVGAGAMDILNNWPPILVGVVMIIIGYCGAKRLWWFKRRRE